MTPSIDISVIITSHAEGILTHKTLRSVFRAINRLGEAYSSEVIIHADNPTQDTLAYLGSNKSGLLKEVIIYTNSFGDLGASRNFAISKATGKYVATIDADDLMSEDWLRASLDMLVQQTEPTIAHSEFTIEFEGTDSLIIKHGEIDKDTDTLLSVYANRWNSVIVAPRELLISEPYAANSLGFGYEDWHLNCRLIAKGVHNPLVPGTAIFVRRKASNSEWLRQIQSMAVLRANPLLSFPSVRNISNPFVNIKSASVNSNRKIKNRMHNRIKKYPLLHRTALRVHTAIKKQRATTAAHTSPVPQWLQNEWLALHDIDRQIFPTSDLMRNIPVYDTITPEHKIAGSHYKMLVDQLRYDSYDYLLFVPWLIRGGADSYAINYANTISRLYPEKRVLVIATLPTESVWSERLDEGVDFLNFGKICEGISADIKHRLLGHIIENSGISIIHVLNSELGYDFVELHEKYIRGSGKKVVVTSFSQSVDKNGRYYGYSHTHVPKVYELADIITSDNQTVIDMWIKDYGFSPTKLFVHRQPIQIDENFPDRPIQREPLRVLWAARIAPEKQPEILSEIAKLVKPIATIDMYGEIETGFEKYTQDLPINLSYKGAFSGFSTLPLLDYDALLYTSLFDGMPNTILEAASNGLPIISSAVGGIPEFIHNNKTGLLIRDIGNVSSYGDAVRELAINPSLGRQLAKEAYLEIKSDFSPALYEKNVKDMLEKLGY